MRARQCGRFLLVALVSVLGMGAFSTMAGATPNVNPVSSTLAFNGISCSSHTDCWAAGDDSSGGLVMQVSNGTPGTPTDIPGSYAIYSVACPSSNLCYAAGTADAPNSPPTSAGGFLVPITSDTVGTAVSTPGTDLYSISCHGAPTCVAVGDGYDSATSARAGAVVTITNGVPGPTTFVPAVQYLLGVACHSSKDCVAVGLDSHGAVVVPIVKGVPGTPQEVGGVGGLDQVACQSSTACYAVGNNDVVAIANGSPTSTTPVSGVANFFGVECRSSGCEAVGEDSTPTGLIVPIVGGAPGSPQSISGTSFLNGAVCVTTTNCLGAGAEPGPNGVVVSNLLDQTAPTITSVKATGPASNPTIIVKGTGFGSVPPAGMPSSCGGTGQNFGNTGQTLFFTDMTAGWGAGTGGDCIGFIITKWKATTIEFQLGSSYISMSYTQVAAADQFQMVVQGVTFSGTFKSV